MNRNEISEVTRQNIADETVLKKIYYCGDLNEPDFLSRLFDLQTLFSRDFRYKNAYDDIFQHTVNNIDYPDNWIYSDTRINLLHCTDDLYLKFLAETIHPVVRSDSKEVSILETIYNKHLNDDGFEILRTDEMLGKPIFSGHKKHTGKERLIHQKEEINKYLDTEYVNGKIKIMTENLNKNTDLAIGTAKELLETTCKSILQQKNVYVDTTWSLSRLIKETSGNVDLISKNVCDADKAKKSISQILGGIASIVQGVSELRNAYGTGHGKDVDFKGLETKYAKLLVGVVSETVIFYLSTNGEKVEIVEK
ncbi:MAG: abortive infection family protein [Prevotellaceae bacterium]|jgi:hypothetical protein|nr:abortive infection family protein [Prevotellaceae bacterium]